MSNLRRESQNERSIVTDIWLLVIHETDFAAAIQCTRSAGDQLGALRYRRSLLNGEVVEMDFSSATR
jgi:hypothetical protein